MFVYVCAYVYERESGRNREGEWNIVDIYDVDVKITMMYLITYLSLNYISHSIISCFRFTKLSYAVVPSLHIGTWNVN